jgi:RimJ/RimL family protein N-acetyltransferase
MEPVTFPDEIATERLHLRRIAPEVTQPLFACVDANRDHLWPFMPWSRNCEITGIQEFVDESVDNWEKRAGFVWVLWACASNDILGTIGLHHLNWKQRNSEVGYWISACAEGQGLVSEALRAVEAAVFGAGLHRIELRCRPDNLRSAAVAKRNGFEQEGRLRDFWQDEGRYYDALVFGKLNPAHTA